jgi:polysaccharide chain length determinant protein (PEP-CTERM system associated)
MNATGSPATFIFEFLKVLFREAIWYRTYVALCFAAVSLAVLGVGLVYPKTFESYATVHADQQNIIRPLLAGQAATTTVTDQTRVVREVATSPRLLKQVVEDLSLVSDPSNAVMVESRINTLRGALRIEGVGDSYIKIIYSGPNQNEVYNIVSKVTDLFIKNSYESKRKESKEAFLFIDKQVKAYKAQLQEAEANLKAFTANNLDGTEASTEARIANLRQQIENTRLNIDEAETRIKTLENELSQEGQFVQRRFRSDVFRESLMEAQSQLEVLRLSYTDDHPDVVSLKHKIDDMKRAISEAEQRQVTSQQSSSSGSDPNINPLYEELRSRISTEKVELNSLRRRLERSQKLLSEEYERLQRIANRQAELAELTRDYDVNRSIYEDMLSRKERARLSMTLDVEGQGVTYRIQEPAVYPLTPKGLRLLHFFLVGPLLGLVAPFAILAAFIYFDPRIRFVNRLESITSVPVLGVVPHITSPLSKRVMKTDVILLIGFLFIVMCVYIALGFARHKGVI